MSMPLLSSVSQSVTVPCFFPIVLFPLGLWALSHVWELLVSLFHVMVFTSARINKKLLPEIGSLMNHLPRCSKEYTTVKTSANYLLDYMFSTLGDRRELPFGTTFFLFVFASRLIFLISTN